MKSMHLVISKWHISNNHIKEVIRISGILKSCDTEAIGNIKAQMTDFERVADEAEQTEEVIPADPDVRNYTYTFYEGKSFSPSSVKTGYLLLLRFLHYL